MVDEDFGRNEAEVLARLAGYANDALAAALRVYSVRISYHYDWELNEAP